MIHQLRGIDKTLDILVYVQLHRALDQPLCVEQHNDHMANLLRKSLNELSAKQSVESGAHQTLADLMESVKIIERDTRRDDHTPVQAIPDGDDSDDSNDEPVMKRECKNDDNETKDSDSESGGTSQDEGEYVTDAYSGDMTVALVGRDKFFRVFTSWLSADTFQWLADQNTKIPLVENKIKTEGEASSDPSDATVVSLPLVHSVAPIQIRRKIFMQQLRTKYVLCAASPTHHIQGGWG